jgi:hypothetical protein
MLYRHTTPVSNSSQLCRRCQAGWPGVISA